MTYSAVSTFTLKPGSSQAFERAIPQQTALIKSQPGCQSIGIVKVSDAKFLLMQTFDTQQHLEDARTATMPKSTLGDTILSREVMQGDVIAS
jgi:hypothetical protein